MPFFNSESHFAQVPSIDIQRSKMMIPFDHKTSFNFGQLIPLYCDTDILPGDTVKCDYSFVARLQTLLTPVMDDARTEIHAFFVPHRLVLNNWQKLMGESDDPWVQSVDYVLPTISSPSGGFARGTYADYLGWPIGVEWSSNDKNAPHVLGLRAIAKCWNDWYRDVNLQYAINIDKSDSNASGSNGSSYLTDAVLGGMPLPVAKTHDYFTSGLPTAQRAGDPVTLPLISGIDAPVYASVNPSNGKLRDDIDATVLDGISFINFDRSGTAPTTGTKQSFLAFNDGLSHLYVGSTGATLTEDRARLLPNNLWADLSSSVGAVTISELRLAFQLQKWYERSAVSGNRYTDLIRGMFSVVSPDARLQRAEFLGGTSTPIVVDAVVNNSESATYKLGNLGAMSNTSDSKTLFEHSFTEHGTLLIFALCRISSRTYSQGLHRQWLRRSKMDFYWPVFAHLGEQPIKEVEIYADGNMDSDDVFGYQEAWAEYRYRPNMCTSFMRPNITGTLSSWHFGDDYRSQPYLSDAWIQEGHSNIDRALAVPSTAGSGTNQVFGEFLFNFE